MRHLTRIVGFTLLVILAGAARAPAQSVYGPGGLFLNPTANMPPAGQIEPSTLVLSQEARWDPPRTGTHWSTWIASGVDYGWSPHIEVGASLVTYTGSPGEGSPAVGGYVKYLAMQEGAVLPAVAVGATYLAGQASYRQSFLALRKTIPCSPLVAHAGVQYLDSVNGGARHTLAPFLGIESPIIKNWSAAAEMRPRLKGDAGQPLALTLIYSASRYHLAFTWANNGPSTGPRFGFGVGLALGAR